MRTVSFYTPVVTAFDKTGTIDATANQAVWDHAIGGGVNGIVLLGSSGEFFAMTTEQKHGLIDLAAAHVAGRTELIVGTAGMRVDETIALSNYALDAGADAVMVIGPYYCALGDDAVFAYFDAVAERVHGDVLLYNYPDRTGYDLSPEVTLRLARKHANIVGYKDTLFSVDHTRRLLSAVLPKRPGFRVLAGFDEFLHRTVTSGGVGAIGGLSNLYPELCARYAAAVRDGDFDRISAHQRVIDKAMELYAIGTPFIPILKKAMVMRGLPLTDHCLAPLQPATAEQTARLRELMDAVEALADEAKAHR